MANRLRGEFAIKVGATNYRIRPSFQAIQSLEDEVGSIIKLMARMARAEISLREATTIMYWGIVGANPGKEPPDRDALGEKIFKHGYMDLMLQSDPDTGDPIIPNFLSSAVSGDQTVVRPTDRADSPTKKPGSKRKKTKKKG